MQGTPDSESTSSAALYPEFLRGRAVEGALKFLQDPPLPIGMNLGYRLLFNAAVPTIQPEVRALIGLQPARGSEPVGRATR